MFWIFFSLIAGRALVETGLTLLNLAWAKKNRDRIPEELQEHFDPEKGQKIEAYTRARIVLSLCSDLTGKTLVLSLLLLDGFAWLQVRLEELLESGPLVSALVFFGVMGLAQTMLSLPFSWYDTFRVENRFGFNRSGLGLWFADLVKGLLLGAILGGLLLSLVVLLLYHAGSLWWLICWAALFGFSLLLTVLYPLIIAPLFNRFTPLEEGEFKDRVIALMEKAGIPATGVFVMDAAKRSTHTNAYFTGLGRSKRIVFYDTLLKKHAPDECLAVLAHEAGHWKKKHVLKGLIAGQALSLGLFALSGWLIRWDGLYEAFGFAQVTPYAGLFLVSLVYGPALFFLQPLLSAFSRKHEYEADRYAGEELNLGAPLRRMLIRSSADNLSNLNPHPWYVFFHYSHPPLLPRIRACQTKANTVE